MVIHQLVKPEVCLTIYKLKCIGNTIIMHYWEIPNDAICKEYIKFLNLLVLFQYHFAIIVPVLEISFNYWSSISSGIIDLSMIVLVIVLQLM